MARMPRLVVLSGLLFALACCSGCITASWRHLDVPSKPAYREYGRTWFGDLLTGGGTRI